MNTKRLLKFANYLKNETVFDYGTDVLKHIPSIDDTVMYHEDDGVPCLYYNGDYDFNHGLVEFASSYFDISEDDVEFLFRLYQTCHVGLEVFPLPISSTGIAEQICTYVEDNSMSKSEQIEKEIKELEDINANNLERIEKLRELKSKAVFDWYARGVYTAYADGDCDNTSEEYYEEFFMDEANTFTTFTYAKEAARLMVWNNILFKLAEFFNPDGWEWIKGTEYAHIYLDEREMLDWESKYVSDALSPKFHLDVIGTVIDELMENSDKWNHLILPTKGDTE